MQVLIMKNLKKKKSKKERKIYLINLESVITPSLDWHHFILPNSSKPPQAEYQSNKQPWFCFR